MKTITKQFVLFFILALSLCNCSKDDGDDLYLPPVTNLRLTDYSLDATEYSVSYNDQGRVSNYNNHSSGSGSIIYNSNHQIIQIGFLSFTYNSQGRISSITEPNDGAVINKEATIVYNNAGLIASLNFQFTRVSSGTTEFVNRTFDYNENNQLVSIVENNASDFYDTRELLTYDFNGNIIQVKKQITSDGLNYTDDSTTNFTYDNKKNPVSHLLNSMGETQNLSLVYLRQLNTMSIGNYVLFRLNYFSNNNVISKQRISSAGVSNLTYDYIYNEENYPISLEVDAVYSDGSTSTIYRTWTYEHY